MPPLWFNPPVIQLVKKELGQNVSLQPRPFQVPKIWILKATGAKHEGLAMNEWQAIIQNLGQTLPPPAVPADVKAFLKFRPANGLEAEVLQTANSHDFVGIFAGRPENLPLD